MSIYNVAVFVIFGGLSLVNICALFYMKKVTRNNVAELREIAQKLNKRATKAFAPQTTVPPVQPRHEYLPNTIVNMNLEKLENQFPDRHKFRL